MTAINTDYLILFTIAVAVVTVVTLATALLAPAKVVEWRLDPPDGEHLMLPSAEPTEEERAKIDAQKRAEVLYHALVYTSGNISIKGMYGVLTEHWNKKLEGWPQYKEWKISHQWLQTNLAQMDFDTSGEVYHLVQGNHADAPPGYYVLVSQADPAAKSKGGRGSGRQLVPVAELVEAWRAVRNNATAVAENGTAPASNATEQPQNGTEGEINDTEGEDPLPEEYDLSDLFPEVEGEINDTE